MEKGKGNITMAEFTKALFIAKKVADRHAAEKKAEESIGKKKLKEGGVCYGPENTLINKTS